MDIGELIEEEGYNQDFEVPMLKPIKIKDYIFIFGECHGVYLKRRYDNDPHILVYFLCEDDGHWFESNSLGDSAWLNDFQNVLNRMKQYFEEECIKDHNGYKFKE